MQVVQHEHRDADAALPTKDVQALVRALDGLFAPVRPNGQKDVRTAILAELDKLGWSGEVRVSTDLNITITSMKDQTAACVQFGNMGRFYADLLKLQALYESGRCDGAVYILPTKQAADAMASNLVNADRLVRELRLFRSIINVPVKILAVQ